MNTSRVGSGTGFGMTVSRIGNAEYQYTFNTPMADNKYVVLAQTQEQQYETTRVKNKTVKRIRVTTAWVNHAMTEPLLWSTLTMIMLLLSLTSALSLQTSVPHRCLRHLQAQNSISVRPSCRRFY